MSPGDLLCASRFSITASAELMPDADAADAACGGARPGLDGGQLGLAWIALFAVMPLLLITTVPLAAPHFEHYHLESFTPRAAVFLLPFALTFGISIQCG